MPYRFATQDLDYSDLSAGRVLYSLPGLPAFPVRLASEIFQRAAEHLKDAPSGLSIYDPTCGGAYHLTALGFLHGAQIRAITASDVDEQALGLARRNLRLLSEEGLAQREAELRRLLELYGKPSHAEAVRSVATVRSLYAEQMLRAGSNRKGPGEITTRVFAADALDPSALALELGSAQIDLVISDIPYGKMSGWQAEKAIAENMAPLDQMLGALRSVLSSRALVAIAADKGQKIAHPDYRRVEHFQVGKRRVVFMEIR